MIKEVALMENELLENSNFIMYTTDDDLDYHYWMDANQLELKNSIEVE